MRMVLIALLILLSSSVASATNWCEDANILGCYLMKVDENPITDSSSGGYDADLKGAGEPNYTTDAPDGYAEGSYDFDGTDDYIKETTQTNWTITNNTNLTIVAWAKSDTFNDKRTLVRYDDADNLDGDVADPRGFYQLRYHSDNKVRFAFGYTSTTTHQSNSSSTITTTQWNHIAGVRDVGSDNVKIYIDGEVKANDTDDSLGTWSTTNTDLLFGRHKDTVNDEFFDGHLTEVALFDTNLSATDINDIMTNSLDGSLASTGHILRGFTGRNVRFQ